MEFTSTTYILNSTTTGPFCDGGRTSGNGVRQTDSQLSGALWSYVLFRTFDVVGGQQEPGLKCYVLVRTCLEAAKSVWDQYKEIVII